MWGHESLECEPQLWLSLLVNLSNYLTSSLWLSTPICEVRHLCVLYNAVNVYILILWLKLVRFYHALSNWPVSQICLSCKDTGG